MKILFAVDGSEISQRAIAQFLDFRCPFGTELKVVSVVDFFEPFPSIEDVKEREIKAAQKLVDDTVNKLKETHKESVVSSVLLDGYAIDEILREAKTFAADLIVVGSHGRTGLSELVLGSVSRAVMHHAPCSVRIIRDASAASEASGGNVLLAVDDSQYSDRLIDHVLALPWSAKTKFRLFHVVPEIDPGLLLDPEAEFSATIKGYYEAKLAGAEEWLKPLVGKLNSSYGEAVDEFKVVVGEAREEILQEAKAWPCDLVMMGSHGRRGIERFLLGSVSEAVATHALTSVEVVR